MMRKEKFPKVNIISQMYALRAINAYAISTKKIQGFNQMTETSFNSILFWNIRTKDKITHAAETDYLPMLNFEILL